MTLTVAAQSLLQLHTLSPLHWEFPPRLVSCFWRGPSFSREEHSDQVTFCHVHSSFAHMHKNSVNPPPGTGRSLFSLEDLLTSESSNMASVLKASASIPEPGWKLPSLKHSSVEQRKCQDKLEQLTSGMTQRTNTHFSHLLREGQTYT